VSGQRRVGAAAAVTVHPTLLPSNRLLIKDGRFGPYVTDGETNASLRKGDDVCRSRDELAASLLADSQGRAVP